MADLIRLADLKNWAYCPRVVYYHRVMPNAAPMTNKMRSGLRAQDLIEKLELRRTLNQYRLLEAQRIFGPWLSDESLGLSGRVDLILLASDPPEAAIVDYKLTAGDPGDNHRLQLHGYALLVEAKYGVPVNRAFLYRIPDDRVFTIPIEDSGCQRALLAVAQIRDLAENQLCPEPTPVRRRCDDCEFANYCGDVW